VFKKLISLVLLFVPPVFGQSEGRSAVENQYPRLIHADVPLYPAVPATARYGGTVKIQVTVNNGRVVNAEVLSGTVEPLAESGKVFSEAEKTKLLPYLSGPSLENVNSWRFLQEEPATFAVTYVYRMEGEETSTPENPKVELNLPHFIRITIKPSRPTKNYVGGKPQ
jgi:hypothetical protein